MCNHSEDFDILCPMCRNNTPMNSVSYVKNNREGEVPSIVIKGSFSTKIESITIKLIQLIAEDPTVKVLIFSTVSFSSTIHTFKSIVLCVISVYNKRVFPKRLMNMLI